MKCMKAEHSAGHALIVYACLAAAIGLLHDPDRELWRRNLKPTMLRQKVILDHDRCISLILLYA